MKEPLRYQSPEHYEHRRPDRLGSVVTALAEQQQKQTEQQTNEQISFGDLNG